MVPPPSLCSARDHWDKFNITIVIQLLFGLKVHDLRVILIRRNGAIGLDEKTP